MYQFFESLYLDWNSGLFVTVKNSIGLIDYILLKLEKFLSKLRILHHFIKLYTNYCYIN